MSAHEQLVRLGTRDGECGAETYLNRLDYLPQCLQLVPPEQRQQARVRAMLRRSLHGGIDLFGTLS